MALLPHINGAREMPRYRSHKTVWALKIKLVVPELKGEATLYFFDEGYEPIKVPSEYVRKHEPKRGGYYVVYTDGYASWSPEVAFEQGYRQIGPAADTTRNIDGKYAIAVRDGIPVIVNKATGNEIPLDEPLALFRSKDSVAVTALRGYLEECEEAGCTAAHLEGVRELIKQFEKFATEHEDRMKVPD